MYKSPINRHTFQKSWIPFLLIICGIMARFLVMNFGYNYDFESYLIVGDIVNKGKIVYAETWRYNYSFVFFLVQGLGYRIASYLPNTETMYRIYIVSILTFADLGITIWIRKKYSIKEALFFFLNPISIVITGYHNQFDNIAVLLALISISFYDTGEKITKKDICSIFFLSFSLLVKHILYIYFVWLLFNNNQRNLLKKMMYVCIPPFIFLVSFIPFSLISEAARNGILNYVFLYRSSSNYPLFIQIFKLINLSPDIYFKIYIIIMLVLGYIFRNKTHEQLLLIYLAAMVAFSSSIANQYLVIPLISLTVYNKKIFYWLYIIVGGMFCFLNSTELHMGQVLCNYFPSEAYIIHKISDGGIMLFLMTLILVVFIISFQYMEYK